MFSNAGAQVNKLDPTALLRDWGLHTVQRFPWVPSPSSSHFHNIIKSSYTFFHTIHRFPWVPSPPSSLLNSSSNTSSSIIIILNLTTLSFYFATTSPLIHNFHRPQWLKLFLQGAGCLLSVPFTKGQRCKKGNRMNLISVKSKLHVKLNVIEIQKMQRKNCLYVLLATN